MGLWWGRLALPILLSMTAAPYLGALALKVGGAILVLALLFSLAVTNLMLVLVLRRLCNNK